MKKIEEYLYNNGLDWIDIILYILMGVLIALAVACIVLAYGGHLQQGMNIFQVLYVVQISTKIKLTHIFL